MEINYNYTVIYTTKCDNVKRYYKARDYNHALSSAKELKKYPNIFKNISILKEMAK